MIASDAADSRISPAENRPYPRLVLIDILVFDGLDEMDAWGPAEVFRSAGKRGSDMETRLVTRQAQDTVLGAYGLRFVPAGIFEPGAADVLVVPGGGWGARDEAGAWGEVQRGDLLPLLGEARQSTSLMAGVCTGTMLLAHAGIVGHDEPRPTTPPGPTWMRSEQPWSRSAWSAGSSPQRCRQVLRAYLRFAYT